MRSKQRLRDLSAHSATDSCHEMDAQAPVASGQWEIPISISVTLGDPPHVANSQSEVREAAKAKEASRVETHAEEPQHQQTRAATGVGETHAGETRESASRSRDAIASHEAVRSREMARLNEPARSHDVALSSQSTLANDQSRENLPTNPLQSETPRTPARLRERVGESIREWTTDFTNAFRYLFLDDEKSLKETVWFLESKFERSPTQQGSGVVIRIRGQEGSKNVLLTCRHVICHPETGEQAKEIRCWPESSGYNPESTNTHDMWIATPYISLDVDANTDFVADGSLDWIALDVGRENQSFDAEPFAPGFAKPRPSLVQNLSPYRLVGFPGGNMTMHRGVVKASISRRFRLSGTDARPGEVVLTGSEPTAAGFSGAPYLTSQGQVVAIHRSLFRSANTLTGIASGPIEAALSDRGWSLVKQKKKSWRYFWIRIASAVLFVSVAYSLLAATAPRTQVDLVEESEVIQFLDQWAEPVGTSTKPKDFGVGQGYIENGYLHYTASPFTSYAMPRKRQPTLTDFVRGDEFKYSRRWLRWIPLPRGTVIINVRDHLTYNSLNELYDDLYGRQLPTSEQTRLKEKRDEWENLDTAPVIDLELSIAERDESRMEQNGTVFFVQKVTTDPARPKIIVAWNAGDFSISKGRSLYLDPRIYQLRNVVLKSHEFNQLLNRVTFEFRSILDNDPRKTFDD